MFLNIMANIKTIMPWVLNYFVRMNFYISKTVIFRLFTKTVTLRIIFTFRI